MYALRIWLPAVSASLCSLGIGARSNVLVPVGGDDPGVDHQAGPVPADWASSTGPLTGPACDPSGSRHAMGPREAAKMQERQEIATR
jgi:hypothetical protein